MKNADFALINSRIWTGDSTQPTAEAFAAKDGKILAVGATVEVRELCSKNTTLFDAEGKLVIPGFIDGHVHFVMGGSSLIETDLTNINSRELFVNIISRQSRELPPGSWLTGIGWDNSRWAPQDLPHRSWVDTSANDRPIYVIRQDMHMAFANSRALELADINLSTANPDGGIIDRDPVTGQATGIVRDAAMRIVENVIPEPDDGDYSRAIEAACRECGKLGVTGVHDITAMEHIRHLEKASHEDWFRLRFLMRPPLREWETVQEYDQLHNGDPALFRTGGLKAFADGSLGSSTALFLEPYSDNPDSYGVPNDGMFPEGNMFRLARDADEAGFHLSIHAIGDKANRQVIETFEKIREVNGKRDRRWRIEHAQHIKPDDFARFAQLKIIASMQPYHCVDDARWCESRIGKERCPTSYAWKTFADLKVPLVFGSDWTVAPLDPLTGIDAAVNRIPVGAHKSWHPEQKISVEEALKAYTINPAYAAFEESIKGTLSPGKFADCVVLSDNLLEIPSENIKDVKVEATIFNGKVVYERK